MMWLEDNSKRTVISLDSNQSDDGKREWPLTFIHMKSNKTRTEVYIK